MIWDRFDDDRDDLYDDKMGLKSENLALEKKLSQLGVKFDPLVQTEDSDFQDQNDMYLDKSQDLITLEVRNLYLKQLLADAEGRKV